MTQHIVVIGKTYECGEPRCGEPATVVLRQFDEGADTGDVIMYCDDCWIAAQRAYQPLTARDERQAISEAEAVLSRSRKSNGDEGIGV